TQLSQPAVPDAGIPGAPSAAVAVTAPASQDVPGVPQMRSAPAELPAAAAVAGAEDAVQVRTDVLSVKLNGGALLQADLLRYPSTAEDDSPPVRLFSQDPTDFFVAQSGWVRQGAPAPSHLSGFELDRTAVR